VEIAAKPCLKGNMKVGTLTQKRDFVRKNAMLQKENDNMIEKTISIGISILMIAMTFFWVGFHNADLSQNYFRIYAAYGLDYSECFDCGNTGCYSCDRVYVTGMNSLIMGIYLAFIGGIVLGTGLNQLKHHQGESH